MDSLLNLIRSLSAKEKSQYVKYARQHLNGKDSNKVALFQLISQELRGQIKDYKKQAAEQFPASTLPSLKTQLYNQILESLTHGSVKTVRGELSQMIDEIQTLMDRGLLKQGLARIEKAKKIAVDNQLHFQFLEISLLQRRIIRQYKTKDVVQLLQAEQAACNERIELIAEEFELLNTYESYFSKRRVGKLSQGALPMSETAERNIQGIRSFEGKAYFYLLEQLGYNAKKDYPNAWLASKKLMEHFERDQTMLVENLPRYLGTLINYLNACIRIGDFEKAKQKLEEVKQIKPKNFYAAAQKQSTIAGQEIILFFHLKEYGKIILLEPMVKRMLDKYGLFIPFERSLGIAYNMAISFFLKNKLDSALDWLNTCLEAKDNTELKEKVAGKAVGVYTQASAMVFRVIVFYEMGNLKLASHFLNPTTYFLENRGMKDSVLWEILTALKNIIGNRNDKLEALQSLQLLLEGNAQYEEYAIWVERGMGKLLKQKEAALVG